MNVKSLIIELLIINAILSAILVIISKNPVISVIFLISLVLNSALFLIAKGMPFLGISYILVVRDAMAFYRGILSSIHCYNMDITPHLTNGESSLVNLACDMKAGKVLRQIKYTYPQVISPMMKATLLESNHPETPNIGLCHV